MSAQMTVRVSYESLPGQGANRSIRTIQALPIDFKPLDYFGTHQAVNLLARPYLHVLFVVCDDNDTYRATIRAQIREWLDRIVSRHHQEWLIVHVTSGKSAGAKFYQRKGAVVDKIKADFNVGKKDRCIQVAQAASADDPTAWAEFSTKVKEAVIASFDSNISLYEENVRKADSQRQLEGWQYLPFFAQKEALADSFEVMGLWEDALVQYDELEASFFQALKEHSMSWFGRFGGTSEGDDASPLLSTSKKPYRSWISANDISVFDFRIYLFARQAFMLFHLGRTAEIARRGAFFISTFARTLRQHQASLGENFCESWTFSACLNIVDECQSYNERKPPDREASAQFTAAKAELLELARKQLDKLGMSAGHLPLEHPFAMSLQEVSSCPTPNPDNMTSQCRPPVSRKDLLDAIENKATFDKLYVDLTNRTIRAFTTSGRKRCSLKLHGSLAALELHRGRQDSAQKLFSLLPAHYVDLRWVKIEAALLDQCTHLQESLDMSRERLLSTLALIRAGAELGTSRWNLDSVCEPSLKHSREEDMSNLAKKLMNDVYTLSSKLAKDFAAIAFPTFSMQLASDIGSIAEGEDGVNVNLSVENMLPCELRVDEVRLKFATPEGESVWFTAPACKLVSGHTNVVLFCPTAITSRLALELSQIRYSRIIFQYSHRPISSRNLAPDPRNTSLLSKQPTVRFPHDHQALEAFVELPDTIDLSTQRSVIVCVAAGRNQVLKAQLKISADQQGLLNTAQIQLLADSAPLEIGDDAVRLEKLAAYSVTRLVVPIVGQPAGTSIKITLAVEYYTVKRSSTKRSFRRDEVVSLALPLAVNVQDFFRKNRVMSKFSVTTEGARALSISSAKLVSTGSYEIAACGRDNGGLQIMPLQTSNFLYKVIRRNEVEHLGKGSLRFELVYSTTEDQLKARVQSAVDAAVERFKLQHDSRWFQQVLLAELHLSPHLVGADLASHLRAMRREQHHGLQDVTMRLAGRSKEALQVVEDVYNSLAESPPKVPQAAWRTLSVPVELPSLDILNLVSVSADRKRTEVGQSVNVELSIRPTFTWSHKKGTLGDAVQLEYDVVVKSDDWVSSGRKRGAFTGKEGSERKVSLTLIPLRAGALFLPSISIRPLETEGLSCETQHVNAACTVEVLPGPGATQSIFLLEQQEAYVV